MKISKILKRCVAYLLMLGIIISGLPMTGADNTYAQDTTTVYFLNSDGWESVGAYVYGGSVLGEELGGWPGTPMEAATELGTGWMKVTVPAQAPFSMILFDQANDTNRAAVYIADESSVYVTKDGGMYTSKDEAETAFKNIPTTVYFFNSGSWSDVYAYAYADGSGLNGEWPGQAAEKASEIGENWWKYTIEKNPYFEPFGIIFTNNAGGQSECSLENSSKLYMTLDGNLYANSQAAEAAQGITSETTVYFLNNLDWAEVGAYVYGNPGQALGGWPGKIAEPATELGGKWLKITVPSKPKFNIIFFDTAADQERAELEIPNERQVYVTGGKEVYGSALEAELSVGLGDPSKMTTVYFYNSRGWLDLNAYTFTKDSEDEEAAGITLGAGWPGKSVESAEAELGENWWKVSVPKLATEEEPFYIVFNDGVNQIEDVKITDKEKVYVAPTSAAYASKEEAEEAAKNATYEDGCEDGPNADLDSYQVSWDGAGAALPYTTYEAENADTNALVLEKGIIHSTDIQSSASQRQAVKLTNTGDYVEFTLTEPANSMVLRYAMPDSKDGKGIDADLSLYVNGTKQDNLELTSKYAWVYGSYPYSNDPTKGTPHRFYDDTHMMFDEVLPAGTKIRLQKDEADTADYYVVDFIEGELVDDAKTQPENSLSITEFGAVADDGIDDYEAISAAIAAAAEQDKEVWIPAGTFDLTAKKALEVKAVTIRGAGMWYSNLEGAGAAFQFSGTCKFYDFAMTGVSTVRDDKGDLAGFEPIARSTNTTIQNVWMEHMKVGIWSANTENLVVQGCRIRNTYADGINLCSLTNNATVRNNNVRNTGDDCIAIWPWLADSSNNTIAHNTVMAPDLANGIALYGGAGNVVEYNQVSDILNNGSGICLGSEFDTKKGYHGKTTVRGNVLNRCGSFQTDTKYPIGAIWIWSTWNPMTAEYELSGNTLNDCSYEGILIDCQSDVSGVTIKNNVINGATDGLLVRRTGNGAATIENNSVANYTGKLLVNEDSNFVLTQVGKGIYDAAAIDVTGVTLNKKSLTLNVKESEKLTAAIAPSDATNQKVSWKSSNENVASVSSDGTVYAAAAGTATITVTTEDGSKSANCTVTVNPVMKKYSVTFNSNGGTKVSTQTVTEGTAAVQPKNPTRSGYNFAGWYLGTSKYNFSSKISKDIVLTAKWEKKTVSVSKIVLTGSTKKIAAGKKITLQAAVTPSNATNKALKWKSSNTKYATVDAKGVVTTKAAGKNKTVTITATAKDGSGKTAAFKLQIMQSSVKSIELTTASKTLKAGKQMKIDATVSPSKNVNKTLKWTSSNTKYATVSAAGIVKAKAAGKGKTVKITAAATDGSKTKKVISIKIK